MIKKNKSGRFYDTKTGYVVSSKKAKKALNKHHHNYPKHRRSIAVKKLTIREYKDGKFDFDFGHGQMLNDGELLYIAKTINHCVNVSIREKDGL